MTSTATTGNQRDEAFDHRHFPRRVNLGCGFEILSTHLNVDFQDFHSPDLVADVRHLDILPTGWYDEVLAQDVLEHLPRADARTALEEWARLLRPGGVLKLRLPNLVGLLELLVRRQTLEEQETLVQCLYGTQAYEGDWHINGFTELVLRHYLHAAGFHPVSFTPKDEWMFDVEAVRAAGPAPLDLGGLRFMRLSGASPSGAAGPADADIHEARQRARQLVDVAAAHSQIDRPPPPEARLRPLKRGILRLAHLFTIEQVEHNRAVVGALRELLRLEEQRDTPPPT